jgi:hypothetical protein
VKQEIFSEMKNKKAVYILLPAVMLIWGLIFYKIFTRVNTKKEAVNSSQNVISQDTSRIVRDTFMIYADYEDIFLKEIPQNNRSKKESNKKKEDKRNFQRRRRIVANRTRWPEIHYKGLIKRRQDNGCIVLIEINNKKCLFHKGDTIHHIYLKRFTKDSVRVIYKNEERSIPKWRG